ncbi:MAG TPA: SapC family protein [Steroidobacteraceae bacterium]|nr:SapC family protein [Steroidobacteraceae bacterium]
MTDTNVPSAPATPVFRRLVALDRKAHAGLKVRPPENASFAADATLVPLMSAEFGPAAREYPVVFVRDSNNTLISVALTGLPQGKNIYVGKDGRWDARYVPAYIRRYPFAFVETSPDTYTICIDADSSYFDASAGTALFGVDGEPSAMLKETIEQLGEYQRMMTHTKSFMKKLDAADILMEANAKADLPDGRSFSWRGFWIIDEARFRNLPQEKIKEWFATGELGLLYAHLLSLGNLGELPRRHPAAPPQK